ncbi:MAG: hypothetical protein H6812_09010 [Phycisphaeraceae bacterium]|nr:hypothetical protein [Phycisphaeraceae bacterium]
MSRRRSKPILAILLASLAVPCVSRAQSPADALEEYLLEHGLSRLRARMLEQEITLASGDQRIDLAERLAELYSQELESAETPEDQSEWERLARNLLTKVPELQSISMRLGLAKARFSAVEKSAEQWRLRMVPDTDRVQIAMLLKALGEEFRELAGRANADVRALEGQEESAFAGDTDLIAESLARSRQQRSLAHYLAAWSLLYQAELAPNPDAASTLAGDAAEEFSWLLNTTPSRVPSIEKVPEQLLKYEHMARAAVAVAACEAIRGDTSAALAWLNLVESAPELPPGVASPLFARKVWILARSDRWRDARSVVDAYRGSSKDPDASAGAELSPLSVVEARLLAVLCAESSSQSPDRTALLSIAIADLISRGEHAHLLDLTRRYSSADLALTGFLAHHVRGLRLYDRARADQKTANENDQLPTRIDAIAKTYLDAASAFESASTAPDAPSLPGARPGNLMLLGMSLYFAGEPAGREGVDRAVAALLEATDRAATESMASESMWMAIRTLESYADRHPSDADTRKRADALIAQFMDRYPSSPRTGEVALRQVLRQPGAEEQSLQMLLAVPEGAPEYDTARRHAEQMAYELFRSARTAESGWLASRYIAIAEPLLTIDQRLAFSGDAEARTAVILRCRRMVDALLSITPPDHDRAERVLDSLASLNATDQPDDLEGEIAFRRAQIALARGDEQEAVRIVEAIRAKDSALAESASRLVLRFVADQWSAAPPASEARIANARRLLALAEPILANELDADALRADPREAAVRVMAGEAALDLWQSDQSRPMLDLAARLAHQLTSAFPNDARVLTLSAECAEATGDLDTALDNWRTLVAATKAGTDEWFNRRLRQLSLLCEVDPDRAREALTQHRTLYPGLGPEPFRARFIELEQRLGLHPEMNNGGGGGGGGGGP